ncbi:MAG: hypothetical protein BWK73_23930 [Thiothrix lacustris]|uniref:Uncharacterized protein n=1 Tax=Thiothrix lacustris TaxID=525917 RepID=A0A1Y1QM32_9GAMM|nr:MAG: hypothetical protein BWK73_23930 [Thiothrix lacustris]
MTQGKVRFSTLSSALLMASSLALLSACGGGSSDTAATDTTTTATSDTSTTGNTNATPTTPDTSVKTGVFIDAPVKGLTYKTATQSGVTNDKGEFKYITGETVTFSLDGVELGSGKAQAKLPVTLISTETYVAQFLQTMDTDANPDLIDVSKIKLDGTTIANFKTRLASALKTGRVIETGGMNNVGLDGLLSTKVLTEIQTASQVALVNQTVVSDSAAAKHVYNTVGSIPWQSSEVSGKVYAKADAIGNKEIFTLNSNGTLLAYSQDVGDATPNQMNGTWLLQNGQLLVTFTGETKQYNVQKISQDDSTIDFWPASTDGTDDSELNEWHPAQPLTLAALNGKHLSFDMTGNVDCTAMTISFSGATATLRDKCGGKYEEAVGTAEAVAGTQNLIKFGLGDKYMLMAISSGDVSKGRMTRANFKGSTLGSIDVSNYTAVSTPLQP